MAQALLLVPALAVDSRVLRQQRQNSRASRVAEKRFNQKPHCCRVEVAEIEEDGSIMLSLFAELVGENGFTEVAGKRRAARTSQAVKPLDLAPGEVAIPGREHEVVLSAF